MLRISWLSIIPRLKHWPPLLVASSFVRTLRHSIWRLMISLPCLGFGWYEVCESNQIFAGWSLTISWFWWESYCHFLEKSSYPKELLHEKEVTKHRLHSLLERFVALKKEQLLRVNLFFLQWHFQHLPFQILPKRFECENIFLTPRW